MADLVQGSKEWHAWRKKGIGASEAAIVMGKSPWNTPFMLWATKTNRLEPAPFHPRAQAAMERGTRLEPTARAKYVAQTGIDVQPDTLVHPDYDFIRVSLDGWNKERKHIVEFKVPGKAAVAKAAKGRVEEQYYWQIMQQFMVSDAETCDYVVYDEDNDRLIVIPVARNREDEAILLSALQEFWSCVMHDVPPKVDMSDLDNVVQRIKGLQEQLSKATEALSLLNDCMLKGSSSDF